MKSMGKMFVFLLITFIGITNVFADSREEYGIEINAPVGTNPETITVYKGAKTNVYNGDTSSIYSYDTTTNTLTLKEGVYYLGVISAGENETFNITSNGKKVYLNMIYGPDITFDNLVSESFDPESSYVWDRFDPNDDTSEPLRTHVHAISLTIKNSNIKLNYTKEYAIYNNNIHTLDINSSGKGSITIQNSTLETAGSIFIENYNSGSVLKELTIKENSKVKVSSLASTLQNGFDILKVDNSTLEVSYNKIEQFEGQNRYATVMFTKISINESDVITNAVWSSANMEIKSSNVSYDDSMEKFDLIAVQTQELTINNSDVELSGAVLVNDLVMNKSNLACETGPNDKVLGAFGYDGSTLSPLVARTIDLTNSNFKAVSKGDVPAFVLIETMVSDKPNFVLHDDKYNVLSLKAVEPEEYGFFNNPNEYTTHYNYSQMSTLPSIYTGVLNGKASKIVYTGETANVTLKVVNGTWEDGTTDDKEVTIVLGQIIDKDFIKTVPSQTNQELKVERTGDNEYSFIYNEVQNPKTGVASLTLLLVATLFFIITFAYYKDELSLFKKL